jgi:hypothetical protein
MTIIVEECLKWIDEHPNSEKDAYENKRKELEEMWRPIITAAYGQQDENSRPSSDDNTSEEPRIDEVD